LDYRSGRRSFVSNVHAYWFTACDRVVAEARERCKRSPSVFYEVERVNILGVDSPTANHVDDFLRDRHTPRFLLRINLFLVQENIERAWAAHAQSHWNAKLAFDRVLEAHGLGFDVVSHEAALDLDLHA
jgi:hypothetical protein